MVNKTMLRTLRAVVPIDKRIVIVNIGTNIEVFDSVAPLVGSMLQDADTDYEIYGDMDKPITALNVKEWITLINEEHKDDFIIGIDACISKSREIGETYLRLDPIKPGSGVGKVLPPVGEVGILGVVARNRQDVRFCSQAKVVKIANDIVDTLLELDKIRKEERREII